MANPYENASSAIAGGQTRPDDLLGIRDQIYSEVGVNDALTNYQNARNELNTFDQTSTEKQQLIGDRTVSMSKVSGIQRSVADKRSLARKSYAQDANTLRDMYATTKAEADTRVGIREKEINEKKALMAEYRGAGINFGDSFESALGKIENYTKELQKEAKKDAEYNSLRAAYTQIYGYPPKNKYNRKKLRKKIKKRSKKMLAQAENRAEQEWQMKIESHQANIRKIQSSIANRGGGGENSENPYTNIYRVTDQNGRVVETRGVNKQTGKEEIIWSQQGSSCPEGSIDNGMGGCVKDDNGGGGFWSSAGDLGRKFGGAFNEYKNASTAGTTNGGEFKWSNLWS